mgnify:CR=1 FL=1
MKDMLYEVRCLKSNEDMILALGYLLCQILRQDSKRKSDFFDRQFRFRMVAITQFENARAKRRDLDRRSRNRT